MASTPGRHGRTLSPDTLHGSHRAIGTFLRWAVREGYGIDGRILDLPAPRIPEKEPTVYHIAQLRKVLAACNAGGRMTTTRPSASAISTRWGVRLTMRGRAAEPFTTASARCRRPAAWAVSPEAAPNGISIGIISSMAAMTLRLDDDEIDALRRRAEQEGRSMQQVVHDALREYFDRHETISWADVAARPPLFAGTRSEIDEAIWASDRDWPDEGLA